MQKYEDVLQKRPLLESHENEFAQLSESLYFDTLKLNFIIFLFWAANKSFSNNNQILQKVPFQKRLPSQTQYCDELHVNKSDPSQG